MADAETRSAPVLDLAQLAAVCGGDREFESLVVAEFRNVTVSALDELDAAIAECDPQRTKAWAHAIKGSAATLGGNALATICKRIETVAALGPDWAATAELAREAREGYAELDRALTARIAADR